MKVVTNSDIKKLIIYAKRNLGIYKLVYRTYKQLYFTIKQEEIFYLSNKKYHIYVALDIS